MNFSCLVYKKDFFSFLRRNALKFIICGAIIAITALVAINNALAYEEFCNYFETNGTVILCFIRRERGLFSLILSALFECLLFLAIMILCSYNDFLSLFSPLVLIIKCYKSIYVDIIILRFLGVCSLVYFILHTFVAVIQLFCYSCASCIIINSSNRYCYKITEMGAVAKELIFVCVGLVFACVLESVVVSLGMIFIK